MDVEHPRQGQVVGYFKGNDLLGEDELIVPITGVLFRPQIITRLDPLKRSDPCHDKFVPHQQNNLPAHDRKNGRCPEYASQWTLCSLN